MMTTQADIDTKTTTVSGDPFIRVATPEDIEQIVDVCARAFIHDPVFNYFGNVEKLLDESVDLKDCANRRKFYTFVVKACFLVGGRVTVVVDPTKKGLKGDKIVGTALWLPPNKRLAVWMVPTMLRAGIISVLLKWRWTGFSRIVFEFQEYSEKKMEECFKTKDKKGPTHKSWYLQLIFTEPDYQGKGLMSRLVREAFAHAPEDTFTLEATTAKSRDRYLHLGFENPTSIKFGSGKADGNGVKAKGADAVGVEIWGMAKWPEASSSE